MAKVISLTQPWAQLVVLGAKKIETRSFSTKHRGLLLIHASLGFPKFARNLAGSDPFRKYIKVSHLDLPLGAIIGSVEVVNVKPTDLLKRDLSKDELAFGDYRVDRFGWILENPVLFDKPIPAKGMLGLWNYDLKEMGVQHG